MSNEKPDMDLIALAALTKGDLKDVDNNSMGGTPHADKLDIRKLAGIDPNATPAPRGRQPQGYQHNPNQPPRNKPSIPNMLKGLDFIDEPKSRPLGQVDMDGMDLPAMPENRPIEFAPIPESIRENVQHSVEQIKRNPYAPEPVTSEAVPIPTPEMDFDLFQFTMLNDMVKNLNVSIESMEGAIKHLTDKRDMLIKALKGTKDED